MSFFSLPHSLSLFIFITHTFTKQTDSSIFVLLSLSFSVWFERDTWGFPEMGCPIRKNCSFNSFLSIYKTFSFYLSLDHTYSTFGFNGTHVVTRIWDALFEKKFQVPFVLTLSLSSPLSFPLPLSSFYFFYL